MKNHTLFPSERFEKLDDDIYRLRIRIETHSISNRMFIKKLIAGRSRKIKPGMQILLERASEDQIFVWDYEREDILFSIMEDEELDAILIEEDDVIVGILNGAVDSTDDYFYLEIMIRCDNIG